MSKFNFQLLELVSEPVIRVETKILRGRVVQRCKVLPLQVFGKVGDEVFEAVYWVKYNFLVFCDEKDK